MLDYDTTFEVAVNQTISSQSYICYKYYSPNFIMQKNNHNSLFIFWGLKLPANHADQPVFINIMVLSSQYRYNTVCISFSGYSAESIHYGHVDWTNINAVLTDTGRCYLHTSKCVNKQTLDFSTLLPNTPQLSALQTVSKAAALQHSLKDAFHVPLLLTLLLRLRANVRWHEIPSDPEIKLLVK